MTKKTILAAILGLAVALGAAPAFAVAPVSPGVEVLADNAALVGQGAMRVTLDLGLESADDGDFTALVGTFDYGLTPEIDLRGILPIILDTPAEKSGLGDLVVGIKWNFGKRADWSFALLPYLALPTGDDKDGLGYGELNLGANLIASWEQPNKGPWTADLNLDLFTANSKGGENHAGYALVGEAVYALQNSWSLLGGLELENIAGRAGDYLLLGGGYQVSAKVDLKAGVKLGFSDGAADSILVVRAAFGL